MADILHISKLNESYLTVDCEDYGVLMELSEFFTFYAPGYRFMPQYRNKMWDGKIRLMDMRSRQIMSGLLSFLISFADQRGYLVQFQGVTKANKQRKSDFSSDNYFLGLNLTASDGRVMRKITPDPFQLSAFKYAVENERCLLVSPTASGKSAIIYALVRYYLSINETKILIVVPTTTLVEQMYKDFGEYSHDSSDWSPEDYCHRIYEGRDKNTTLPVVITTWQSIYKQPATWFKQFRVVVGDEAHGFQAKSLTRIMTNLTNAPYRIGTSGTLQDTKVHKLTLQGIFGDIFEVTTTKELIDKGRVANLQIHCIMLEYSDATKKDMRGAKYPDEIQWLIDNKQRNKFLRDLALSLKGNTLVLYQRVEDHGKPLYYSIADKADGKRKVYFVHGDVKTAIREDIRAAIENETNGIIVASYGTFKQGINIKNLHNIILASPLKSRIVNLQSIGRGLRKGSNKTELNLYDLGDNLMWKKKKNHTLNHFLYRVALYIQENFDYKLYSLKVKDNG